MEDKKEHFGQVSWCEEDLKNVLEVNGYPVTEKNIAKLYNLCNSHWFIDCMIEAGWEYINNQVGHSDGWDK